MTRRSLSRRLTAILLVLALAVALVPAALAAASCPQCGGEVEWMELFYNRLSVSSQKIKDL